MSSDCQIPAPVKEEEQRGRQQEHNHLVQGRNNYNHVLSVLHPGKRMFYDVSGANSGPCKEK